MSCFFSWAWYTLQNVSINNWPRDSRFRVAVGSLCLGCLINQCAVNLPGEILRMTHVARGLDADGALLLDVVVSGHVLQLQSVADVSVKVKLLPVPPLLSCMCTPLTRRKAGSTES